MPAGQTREAHPTGTPQSLADWETQRDASLARAREEKANKPDKGEEEEK